MRSTHLLCVPIQPLAEFPISLRWMFNLFLTVFWWKLPTLSMLPFNKLTIATVTFWKIHNVDDLLQKLWRLRPNHCHIQLITQYLHVLLGNDCVFSFSFPIFLHVTAPDVPRLPRFARRCYKSSFGSSLAVLGCEDMIGNQHLALSIGQMSLPLLLASNFVRTDFLFEPRKKPQCIVYVRELYCITFAKEKCWVAKDRESNLLRERSRKRSLKIFQIGCFVQWEWTSGNGREVDTRGIVEALGLSCGSRVSQLGL